MTDTEKITINMSVVDLGQVDLLVSEGFYSSRTDFIRTAIRNQLIAHSHEVKQSIVRKAFALGAFNFNKSELEAKRGQGIRLDVKVIGLLHIASDVTPELAREVFQSIEVLGVFRCSESVKVALADITKQG